MATMTDEQRTAVGERLRAGRANAAKARNATAEQMLAATMTGQTEITKEDIFSLRQRPTGAGEAAQPVAARSAGQQQATVTHETSAKVWMFKPTPQGFMRRLIPASNIGLYSSCSSERR